MKKIILLFILIPFFSFSQNSINMSLLGTYDYSTTQGNDIWGWVDGSNNEYALVGLRSGFSVVNVTNPASPIEEFFISDVNSTWRDIKTWGNYAYVTTEASAGLLIVDLTDMTGNTYSHVTQFTNNNGGSVSFTSAHDIYIDENGIAYIFGAGGPGPQSNGAIFLDVNANPMNPVYLGEWSDEYIHDGMVRGDTMWAGCIYDGKVFCVDVSDKTNPQTLGSATTPNAFTHNAWVSDNGDYVFTTDEQSGAYLTAFDVSNPSNIFEVDRIQSNPGSNSIPHNTFVDGNFLITSYYRDGTTVHDITYPNYMIQVAYYDSYTGNGNGFDGCWGTYPFLPSGNIISSDINSGPGGSGRLLIYGRDFQQACYLQGNVTDGITSLSINNASIEILSTSINENTNLIGFYQTASVNSGTFQVVFSALGYSSDTLNVSLVNGVMTILNATLFPPCNTFNLVTNNNVQICSNTSYTVGNSTYNTSGLYSDTLTNYFGCDSIVNTNLIVNQSYDINSNDTICNGQILIVGSSQYNQSGVYTDILSTNFGCDSIITTNLMVLPTSSFMQSLSFCSGDSVIVGSNIYTQTGFYTDIFISANGCDSTITTDLTVFASSSVSNYQEICNGETYWIRGNSYSTSGNYTDIFTSVNGCDSIVNTSLTVYPTPVINNNYLICEGDFVIIGNNTYTLEGDYRDTLQTIYGCDSVINSSVQWSTPIASLTLSGTNINASVSGGTASFIFEIYGPSGLLSSTQNNGTTIQFNPLINGQYYFIVTDYLGCISDTSFININHMPSSISDIQNSKELLKIVDVLGRETPFRKNTLLFFISKDGRVEKKIFIE
ncbi:MAG: choice-of-anchor B family protein [Flavobacteriales bacterium]|jgi:choice-of-anchor B domain-containing protein|nr:choice-of-anchor B family protein [Flavobacteriales bacterium]MBT6013473.1 choice-of-anchor B family protein [Flavobacteriales bacterium]